MKSRRRLPIRRGFAAFLLLGLFHATAARAEVWRPIGPDGGGPRVLAVAPSEAQRLYAALPWTQHGLDTRVVRSDDGGTSWRPANAGLGGEKVISLAVDPADPDRVFAVTGAQGCFSDGEGGVFRSADGGGRWTRVATLQELGGLDCRSTVLVTGDAVLLAAGGTIWRSADGGATWGAAAAAGHDGCYELVAHPSDRLRLYCVGVFARLQSRDGGATWAPLADLPARTRRAITAFASAAPRTLYEYNNYPGTLYRSFDHGVTWDLLAAPQGSSDETDHLLVDPRDRRTLYLSALHGLFVSRDRGESWSLLRRGLPELSPYRTDYAGVHELLADPEGDVLAATTQGLFRSEDSGRTWRAAAGRGLHQNAVTLLRFDPHDPQSFLLRSFDALYATRDGGRTFARLAAPFPRPPQVLEFDPFTPGRLLAHVAADNPLATGRLYESRDGGASWAESGWTPGGFSSLAFASAELLVAASGEFLFRSADGGRSWDHAFAVVPDDERSWFVFERVLADRRRPTHLYALGFAYQLHAGFSPVVYRSADSGLRWELWAGGFADLAFPRDPRAVYGVRYDTLLSTRDGGRSFQEVGTLPLQPYDTVTAVLVDRQRKGVFWGGTGGNGVLRSVDGGRTWAPVGAGLPNGGRGIGVVDLAQDLAGRVYATLATGGLWRLEP